MNDTDAPNRVWPLSWLVKLILTVIAGGTLAGWTFWRFSPTYNDPLRSAFVLHVATVFFWADVTATSLCLLERTGWRKAVATGLVLALTASVVITIGLVLLFFIVAVLVDSSIH